MAYVPENVHHEHHYVERDTGSSAGVWAIVAVLVVLLALLLFGSRLFGGRSDNESTDINIRGNIQTPSSGTGGTGETQ